jgi:alpha-glucosidase
VLQHHRDLTEPHHDGSPAYTVTDPGRPVAAPTLGEVVRVRVEVPHAAGVSTVHLRTVEDGEPAYAPAEPIHHGHAHDVFEARVPVTGPTQRYRFLLDGPSRSGWLSQAGFVEHDVTDVDDFALVAGPPPPDWVADGVLYQVFPDRFARAGTSEAWPSWADRAAWGDPVRTDFPASMRQLYGGDLAGIAQHVDHLVDLGVTGIYLNPIFPAPENHRYCASSFDEVDPFLGGDRALAELAATLHAVDLRLIGDLTVNHSGSTHPWFAAAQADADSIEAGFYHFIDHPDRYHSWAGVGTLPKFDHRSEELRRRLYEGRGSVAERYLAAPFHLDGWRVDAANMAGRCGDVDLNHDIQRRLLATMRDVQPDSYLLAEHCHDATADLQGGGWHGTMDYTGFTRPAWSWLHDPERAVHLLGPPAPLVRRDATVTARTIDLVRAKLPWRSVVNSLSLLGSHDTARWAWVAGDAGRRDVGLAWLLTFPGVPSLFYGDELGLDGANDNAAREPMPWDDRDRWDEAALRWTRRLVALRRSSVALRRGGMRWVHTDGDTMVYVRHHPDERVLVALYRDAAPAVTLDAGLLRATHATGLLDHGDLDGRAGTITLPAADGPIARAWRLDPPPP